MVLMNLFRICFPRLINLGFVLAVKLIFQNRMLFGLGVKEGQIISHIVIKVCLGIPQLLKHLVFFIFHLDTKYMFDLNYKVKLKQIEQTLNCWRARNLSLVGKICVIKTLLLPQLLYQFSVLCIKTPKTFFDSLNKLFLSLSGMGVMIELKRKIVCTDYSMGDCVWWILILLL